MNKNIIVYKLSKFYQQVHNSTHNQKIIRMKDIVNKCVTLKFDDSTFISNMCTNEDHD